MIRGHFLYPLQKAGSARRLRGETIPFGNPLGERGRGARADQLVTEVVEETPPSLAAVAARVWKVSLARAPARNCGPKLGVVAPIMDPVVRMHRGQVVVDRLIITQQQAQYRHAGLRVVDRHCQGIPDLLLLVLGTQGGDLCRLRLNNGGQLPHDRARREVGSGVKVDVGELHMKIVYQTSPEPSRGTPSDYGEDT